MISPWPTIQEIDSDPILSALCTILNIEGAAKAGGRLGAFKGLDVPYHFAQVRTAIELRTRELRERVSPEFRAS